MTAIDEISLRNPDALLNGEAMIGVMKSCVLQYLILETCAM